MYYSCFRIQNFKGIRDTTVRLTDQARMGVFAFVGLNESGKTTILEAIHTFSPDPATSELVGGDKTSGVPFSSRVPRHLISNFSGEVSVIASVRFEGDEKEELIGQAKKDLDLVIDSSSIPDEISLERHQKFLRGDFVKSFFSLRHDFQVKSGKQKKWRHLNHKEREGLRDLIYSLTPDIAYFPTFVFDFPERIFLTTERGDKVSNFYRRVFQDILDYDKQGHTIEESIIRRVRSESNKIPWPKFLERWNLGSERNKIQHVMDRASSAVTEVVFGRWNKIFGEDAKGKEISISFETLQGERRDETGALTNTDEHDVYIKFQVRDGTRRFNVNDRSLGFRWFFAFMMFTQFRVARATGNAILFLFDEPASNLHAAAQQKLIESFPEIAKKDHTLAYTTHSHYMIEPKWLEQTFVVTNRADAPNESLLETISLEDESLDVRATRYREFVNTFPNQTNYFQPILDRLKVVPSRFDIARSSVIVEGKSDYYVLRFAANIHNRTEFPLLPGLGASTFGALVSLHIGWGLRMLFILDGDEKGKKERIRYVADFGLDPSRILTLDEIDRDLLVIEDLLDEEALAAISRQLDISKKPTKSQILRFFQESLARDDDPILSPYFLKKSGAVLDRLEELL